MKRILPGLFALGFSTATALAHSGLQEHAHPHTDAASYFTVETLVILALGLSIGGTVAWYRRRKETNK
jgi:NhaP-type Na+/H+ or K+/H+ antiporter